MVNRQLFSWIMFSTHVIWTDNICQCQLTDYIASNHRTNNWGLSRRINRILRSSHQKWLTMHYTKRFECLRRIAVCIIRLRLSSHYEWDFRTHLPFANGSERKRTEPIDYNGFPSFWRKRHAALIFRQTDKNTERRLETVVWT